MAKLYQVPTQNSLQYTLDSAYTAGGTTLTLSSTLTGIVQAPGVCVVDRVDSSGNLTATKRDYFTFTGVSGAQLTGVAGGLAGSTNQDHAVGAIVEFIPDIVWAQALYDVIGTEHSVMGQHTSLPSVTQLRTLDLVGWSSASLSILNTRALYVASLASLQAVETNMGVIASQASINRLNIRQLFSASGASLVAIFPSGASGGILQSIGTSTDPYSAIFSAVTSMAYGDTRFKVLQFTYDISTASGNVDSAAIGFDPKAVVIIATVNTTVKGSWGYSDGSTQGVIYERPASGYSFETDKIVAIDDGAGANAKASITLGTNKFTLAWTKTGSPTGTAQLFALCFR